MRLQDIERLMKRLDESSLTEINWTIGEEVIVLKKEVQVLSAPIASAPISQGEPAVVNSVAGNHSATTPDNTSSASNFHEMTSPMVGSFYSAASPEVDAFVKVGDHVKKGQTVCIIEAMKLMNEIEADVDGIIEEICVQNESPVEFGTVLFRINKG